MVKLWQGLMPAPAFALLALAYRWQPWPDLVKVGLKCAAIFLVTAFWWPVIVWLTPGAYDAVMHADSVWHMIFGWNLFERYGELEYGARHRKRHTLVRHRPDERVLRHFARSSSPDWRFRRPGQRLGPRI